MAKDFDDELAGDPESPVPREGRSAGLLSAAGAMSSWADFAEVMDEVVALRHRGSPSE